jgi:hypothetical protein
MMIVILPTSLLAQDPNRGLLHNDGGTWLNEVQIPTVAAIFPDSLVQTEKEHTARIDVDGSSVLIGPETMVQFQGHELVLDHGSLQLDTSRQMEVIVGCITISPISGDRTQYEVTDAGGKVHVAASQKDVKIHSHGGALRKSKQGSSSDLIVHQGEHDSRDDRCPGAIQENKGNPMPLLDTRGAVIAGTGIVALITCLGLCHGSEPMSPSKP